MPITKQIELYTYGELSESAKETAREWWRNCMDETDYQFVLEDFQRIAEILGVSFRTHDVRLMSGNVRSDPNIWWSLGYCQSDFAAFEGQMNYRKGMTRELKKYAPEDAELQSIASDLAAIFARGFYRDSFKVTYSNYYGSQVSPSEFDWTDGAHDRAEAVKAIVRRMNDWLYQALRKEHEYLTSEEQIAEVMEANGYTFREDGKREN